MKAEFKASYVDHTMSAWSQMCIVSVIGDDFYNFRLQNSLCVAIE